MKALSILLIARSASENDQSRAALAHCAEYHIIACCTNSKQAYALILLHHPDLVICDMVMDAPDGLALLRRLQPMKNRPLFLLTSYLSSDTVLRSAHSSGADYFLLKPFMPQQLRDTIRMMLAGRLRDVQPLPSRSVAAKVHAMLIHSGYVSTSHGFHYIATAVELLYEQPQLLSSLTKALYVEIARIHNTTVAGVERDIRHTIHTTCLRNGTVPQSNGNTLRMMLRTLQQMI